MNLSLSLSSFLSRFPVPLSPQSGNLSQFNSVQSPLRFRSPPQIPRKQTSASHSHSIHSSCLLYNVHKTIRQPIRKFVNLSPFTCIYLILISSHAFLAWRAPLSPKQVPRQARQARCSTLKMKNENPVLFLSWHRARCASGQGSPR